MSESLFLFQMMVKGIADNDDLNEEFGEEQTGYLRNALQCFCEEHKDNPTDKSLIDSFDELEKLGRNRHTTGCKEVQNEVHNIYQFFDKIEMLKPEMKIANMKRIQRMFGSKAYKNVIDGGSQKGISWFISRAIEIYLNNMEKENANG